MPTNLCRELIEREFVPQTKQRVLLPPNILPGGYDEVGVLLLGHKRNGYWYLDIFFLVKCRRYGCNISIERVRELLPHVPVNATTMPVTFGVIAGLRWAMSHPTSGIVEPVGNLTPF